VSEALRWYLATLLIGGAGLLPAAVLFGSLRSSGVLYARPLAWLLLSVGGWWLGWSGVVPYGRGALLVVLLVLWAASGRLALRRPALLRAVTSRWRLLLVGELAFLVVFGAVGLARAQAPDAAHTEKPMDLMMLMSVHRADVLPPPDPWLSGEAISYYHLGHLGVDAVGQLSGVGPEFGFNLGVALVGAMAAAAVFGLAGDVLVLSAVRRRATPWIAGVGGMLALLWVAPLAGLLDIIEAQRESEGGGLAVLDQFWWWWDATRVLTGPITEFPAFSLLLGDLHAHLLALPLSLLALALALVTFQGETPLGWRRWLQRPGVLALSGATFGALFMMNSWDVITFGLVWFAAAVMAFRRTGWNWPLALFNSGQYLLLPVGTALLIAAPFIVNLESPSMSLGLVASEASPPWGWLKIWLVPLLPLLAAAIGLRVAGHWRHEVAGISIALAAVGVWALIQIASGNAGALSERGSGWVMLLLLAAVIGAGGASMVRAEGELDQARSAWLGLVTVALGIMLVTELVNIETGTAGRFNTVFKLWYHLWTLMAVAGAVAFAMLVDRIPWPGWGGVFSNWRYRGSAIGLTVAAVVYVGAMVYAPAMAVSRGREGQTTGLDSLAYLERTDPGLAGAVAFAQTELDPTADVLLQAVGNAYGPGGYLAAASGVPTVLNWAGHQVQWRGPDAPLAGRNEAVDRIYNAGATADGLEAAERVGVTYVYVGRLEREQFGLDVADRFDGWPVAWAGSGAVIFGVPR
jgi:YYY domain-containing protein